jgi:ferredoxin-NADP reductase
MRFETIWTDAVVRRATNITPEARLLEIVPEHGAEHYAPGSHIQVSVLIGEGNEQTPDFRCYSLVGEHPTGDKCGGPLAYRIAIKRHTESRGGSQYMWSLQEGAKLRVSNPQNLFALNPDAPQYLLIAGGIGIAPIVSMASALQQRGADFQILYAGHSRAGMPFTRELLEPFGDRLRLFCSEDGQRIDIPRSIQTLVPEGEAYVCGPLPLLDAVRAAWQSAGRPDGCLRFETFASSGRFASEPFWVEIADLDRRVLVPGDKTMLSALNEAGIQVLSDCLRGECGLCRLEVLESDGILDHRDVFLSEREKASCGKICACVSRVVVRSAQSNAGTLACIKIDAGVRSDRFEDQKPWKHVSTV